MKHINSIENFSIRLDEHREPKLSQFVLDNLNDIRSRLHHYNGNFAFLKSVKDQYKRKGYLTDTQWKAVYNCFYK
jgi:sensor domain CHASE-containing protein